jgi:hypothetical protein
LKHRVPLSLRFSPELEARLEECAKRLNIKKATLAQMAIQAAVEAIEKNGYRIVMPIQFETTHTPEKKFKYPAPRPGDSFDEVLMEEKPAKKKTA